MKVNISDLLEQFTPLFRELGFSRVTAEHENVMYELPNGIRLICSLERYSDSFIVTITAPNVEQLHSMSGFMLMEALAPERAASAVALMKTDKEMSDRMCEWWRIFFEFLHAEGRAAIDWPWSNELKEKYYSVTLKKLSDLGLRKEIGRGSVF